MKDEIEPIFHYFALFLFDSPHLLNNNVYLTHDSKANVRQSSVESRYNVSQFKEYKIVKSKSIIDRIDDYICPLYGLTDEERDFVKNYELEFRMAGDD